MMNLNINSWRSRSDITTQTSVDEEEEDNIILMNNQQRRSSDDQSLEIADVSPSFDTEFNMTPKNILTLCEPYLEEKLKETIESHGPGSERRKAIINCLKYFGVKTFVIDGGAIEDPMDILINLRTVIAHVSQQRRVHGINPYFAAVLYQDNQGRLFNLKLPDYVSGKAKVWQQYLDDFSPVQAITALMVLSRSIPCLVVGNIDGFQPAFWALVTGVVLAEEIGQSWANASILVRSLPSMGAHVLTNSVETDFIRKIVVLSLAVAAAAEGTTKTVCTSIGIILACVALLVNLGSRTAYFMRLRLPSYNGIGSVVLSYLGALIIGALFPFLAVRTTESGGSRNMLHISLSSTMVGFLFALSHFNALENALVVGTSACNQDLVDIVLGAWLGGTSVLSLFLARYLRGTTTPPCGQERFLKVEHVSPLGCSVPHLPDYTFDPSKVSNTIGCIPLDVQLALSAVLAFAVGASFVYFGFTGWDEDVTDAF